MKVVLAGSPAISIKAFQKVIDSFNVVAIITQPDKPGGRRGLELKPTEVSKLASENNIKQFKPNKVGEILNELKTLDYDILLTFAYGQYIPTTILSLGKFSPINIHGSLLPKYRGAAPIHYAILNNDKEIGITLIEMTKEMDAGKMFFQASQQITPQTTTSEAYNIISELAETNIVTWLNKINSNDFKTTEQGLNFTTSPKIDKALGQLTASLTIDEAMRKVKGLSEFPCSYIFIDQKRIKIFNASLEENKNALKLKFSDGAIYAFDYQVEGKKRIKLI